MAKPNPISWRPTEEVITALAELMQRTGKSRSKLLNDLIMTARHGPEIVADNDQGSAATARARIHAAGMATAGVVDREKNLAFQKQVGMTVFDAKRRGKR